MEKAPSRSAAAGRHASLVPEYRHCTQPTRRPATLVISCPPSCWP